jgi:hypothetical protein
MLTEPREALPRNSTFELVKDVPGAINLTTAYEDASQPPLHTKALYRIENGVLMYCIAPPGRDRPAALRTRPGDEYTLVVLKRAAP